VGLINNGAVMTSGEHEATSSGQATTLQHYNTTKWFVNCSVFRHNGRTQTPPQFACKASLSLHLVWHFKVLSPAYDSGVLCKHIIVWFFNRYYKQKCNINPLQTKRRLFYLKTQSVPRCKHFSSRL